MSIAAEYTSSINDELFVDDYLAPHREPEQ